MAGTSSLPSFETTSEQSSFSQCLPITTVIEQFEVEYAQFVNYPPLESLIPTHPALVPHSAYFRNRFRGCSAGAWLKFAGAGVFLKLVPGTFTASGDTVIMIYHRYKVLEEHYVSRLHFSWPQVTCISGFPARGTRAVVLSYRDGRNFIQKFACRFSTTQETDRFISALKDTLEDTRPEVNAKIGSGLSSQQEYDPSNCSSYISFPSVDESWRSELSLDSSSCYIPTTTDHEAAQASNGQRLILNNEAEEIISNFPPSFTSFLMNCCPTAEQGATKPRNPEEVDFKSQLMNYMKDPSFKDILSKAEQLITELGDNVQFP